MKTRRYIPILVGCLALWIIYSLIVSDYSDTLESGIRAHYDNTEIFATIPFDGGCAVLFTRFDNRTHYIQLEVFHNTEILGRGYWKRSPFVEGYSMEGFLAEPGNENLWEPDFVKRLSDTEFMRWGISPNTAVLGYLINGVKPRIAETTINGQKFYVWYILSNASLQNVPITNAR